MWFIQKKCLPCFFKFASAMTTALPIFKLMYDVSWNSTTFLTLCFTMTLHLFLVRIYCSVWGDQSTAMCLFPITDVITLYACNISAYIVHHFFVFVFINLCFQLSGVECPAIISLWRARAPNSVHGMFTSAYALIILRGILRDWCPSCGLLLILIVMVL